MIECGNKMMSEKAQAEKARLEGLLPDVQNLLNSLARQVNKKAKGPTVEELSKFTMQGRGCPVEELRYLLTWLLHGQPDDSWAIQWLKMTADQEDAQIQVGISPLGQVLAELTPAPGGTFTITDPEGEAHTLDATSIKVPLGRTDVLNLDRAWKAVSKEGNVDHPLLPLVRAWIDREPSVSLPDTCSTIPVTDASTLLRAAEKLPDPAPAGKWLVETIPSLQEMGFPPGYDDVPDKVGPDGRPIPYSRYASQWQQR